MPIDLAAIMERIRSERPKATDGVVLFSGGMDSVGMAVLGARRGLDLLPVYMSHRANVGNVTKKEITAARKLAKEITGHELLVVKAPHSSGREPAWYGKNILHSNKLPVVKSRKDLRNRIFLDVLHEHDLLKGQVVLGVFGAPHDMSRADDVTKAGLTRHARKSRRSGFTIIVGPDWGLSDKEDMLREIGRADRDTLYRSESCLMYFNKPCGNCWSCVDRVKAFLAVWGEDKTPYRPKSTAGRLARSK